jgi:excisionase family DNA binding protein
VVAQPAADAVARRVTRWLKVADVADELGYSPRTVLRWIERGELAAIRTPGGQLRVARRELDQVLEQWATAPERRLAAVDDGSRDADG